jgi:hypothetical protein
LIFEPCAFHLAPTTLSTNTNKQHLDIMAPTTRNKKVEPELDEVSDDEAA